MPDLTAQIWGKTQTALAAVAVFSWGVALWQAAPRLLAGPICSSAQDLSVLAGHCPACPATVLASLALMTSLALRWRDLRRPAALASQSPPGAG
ncbi:hypothetical protein [Caulobacter henricii]|uniref:hypothetical protein n=1 Tax=Caulobacter henricii TaxID=69395 RepID=UPI000A71D056|nr:hypothetical protein [Caulobacter henricii]